MMEVEAPMTISGIFASVAIGATASALGVGLYPANTATLELTTSSCAMRFACSGMPPSSRMTSSTRRPAMVAPFRSMNSFVAARICLPFSAKGPVRGADNPILMVSCADASAPGSIGNAQPATPATAVISNRLPSFADLRLGMAGSPHTLVVERTETPATFWVASPQVSSLCAPVPSPALT
jgi:hypothetical protein